MAYHGTRPGAVRRMLDKGELLFTGELLLSIDALLKCNSLSTIY